MKRNKWKHLFIGLLVLNLVVLVWIGILIGLPPKEKLEPQEAKEGQTTEFTIISTKQDLNRLMNSYLTDLSKNKKIDYAVSLEDDVKLQGTILAFGNQVSLTMTFEPEVQKNGDLLLKQKSVSIGRLYLPSKKVLEYLKANYNLPEWVIVEPKREEVYVALTKMKTKSNFKVKVEKFNPERNEFAFKITVPDTFNRVAINSF